MQKVAMEKMKAALDVACYTCLSLSVGRHNLNLGGGGYLDTFTKMFTFLVLDLLIVLNVLCFFLF